MRSFIILCASVLLLIVAACEESNQVETIADGCSVVEQNRFVHEVMLNHYLYDNDIPPTLDYSRFASPLLTLNHLVDRSIDRFSSITNAAEFESLFQQGQYLGYGFGFTVDDNNRVWIQFIYQDSPSGRSQMRRGDEILAINATPVSQVIANDSWGTIFGPDQQGYPLTMEMSDRGGLGYSVSLSKDVVNINTVLDHRILNRGGTLVGYMAYKSFLSTSTQEFIPVFEDFSNAGISQLILDMRYNGGGSVSVANTLASYLYDNQHSDELFSQLLFNEQNRFRDTDYFFQTLASQLDLQQLIVITSAATCSASEMIINGLQPYMDVRTVGSATCGKPVGQAGFRFCEQMLLPVTFEIQNRDGDGDYFEGIAATCAANDDLSHDFGDQDEAMLATAIHLLEQDSCPLSLRAAERQRHSSPPLNSDSTLREIIGAY